MSAIRVFIKFICVFYDFGPQRIQMDITNQFKQINVFLTQNGFVAILKQVTMPLVAPIIIIENLNTKIIILWASLKVTVLTG